MKLILGRKQIAKLEVSKFKPINNYRTIFVNHSFEESIRQLLMFEAIQAWKSYVLFGINKYPDYEAIYDNHRNDYIYSLLNPEE